MAGCKGGPASCLDIFHPTCVQDLHVCVFVRHHQHKRCLDVWIVGGEHQTPWTSRSHFLNTALIPLKNYVRGGGVNFRKTPPQPPKRWRQQFQRQWGRSRLRGDPMGRSQVRPSHIAPGSCIRSTTIIKSILCQMHHYNCLRCITIIKYLTSDLGCSSFICTATESQLFPTPKAPEEKQRNKF